MGADGQKAAVEATTCLDHCTMRGCFLMRRFFYSMQRPLCACSGHHFFQKTGVTWNLRCLEKYQNQKVSKTKYLELVKIFLWHVVVFWKFKNRAGITVFVCRNRYNSYDSVGFVPGGNIFGTLYTTQDETMSVQMCAMKIIGRNTEDETYPTKLHGWFYAWQMFSVMASRRLCYDLVMLMEWRF